jgi:HD-GYP domain-containing protein (c-di-GMP phosphodiesterase class II)
MQCAPLASVKHRVTVGVPLPFDVFNTDRTLVLAKGKVIDTTEQFESLMTRGVLVDLDELLDPVDVARRAPPAMLQAVWAESRDRMVSAMRSPLTPGFNDRLEQAIGPVEVLIQRDPDLAILQVMRQEQSPRRDYGIHHSMRASVIASLIASRLGWSAESTNVAVKCALTMNLAMLDLQGVLAGSGAEPDAAQRREIITHPVRSRHMLEDAGITDEVWLRAVEQHHERADGRGYPTGTTGVSEIASLVRCADIYAATVVGRHGRDPLPPDRAVRKIYASEPNSPFAAALVKEVGLYPPGTIVSLASGETGIVIRRGSTIISPVVAAICNRYRQPLSQPARRDTAQTGYGVTGIVQPRDLPMPIRPQTMTSILAL